MNPKIVTILDRNLFTPEIVAELYSELERMPLLSLDEAAEMLSSWTMVEEALGEAHAERYIKFSQNTSDEELRQMLDSYIEEVEPVAAEANFRLNTRVSHSTVVNRYIEANEKAFHKQLKRRIEIFRQENVAVSAETEILAQDFAEKTGELSIRYKGEELTMEQAAALLEGTDRAERGAVYQLMLERRIAICDDMHGLMDELLKLRYRIATNAGFKNYRDYRHYELERFDYTVPDVASLHSAIQKHFVPLADRVMIRRKSLLGYSDLMPWDLSVDPELKQPLRPFETAQELITRGREALNNVDSRFGQLLDEMAANGHLDVETRDKKAPGAFSFPLPKSKASFLFMNAASTHDDVVTLMHEMGHAMHDKLCSHHPFYFQKDFPMEVAELASMSMELISSTFWVPFYPEPENLNRARVNLLEGIVLALPWIAVVDEFQHWLYTHPEHSRHERDGAWTKIYRKYASHEVCYKGVEEAFVFAWQRQTHIFEEPFYYIEYAIAQLGALELWKRYREKGQEALNDFFKALSSGGRLSVPEVYKQAGLHFSFSEEHVAMLAKFLDEQLEQAYCCEK